MYENALDLSFSSDFFSECVLKKYTGVFKIRQLRA